jgi:hypothetical protein
MGLSDAGSKTRESSSAAATAWAALALDEAQLDAAAARAMVGADNLLLSQLSREDVSTYNALQSCCK